MKTKKIFNDPIYGFTSIPDGIIYKVVEHPYFQRLRRISQLGLTSLVYSGATHNRFNHALGAFRLMQMAILTLRGKDVEISKEEEEAALLAILLHDIGHGPFSHALEQTILPFHHEELSIAFMKTLNDEFNGALDLTIEIFQGKYSRNFFHQLISSQLDVDRMDYLNRDSFYTGVHEGVIGYDRILQMINVVDDNLVIEEKGLYSVQKFLVARNLMYRQAYLHKTSIAAEHMLIRALLRVKKLVSNGSIKLNNTVLSYFLQLDSIKELDNKLLDQFSKLDDYDIWQVLKDFARNCDDETLKSLAKGLIDRNIYKIIIQENEIPKEVLDELRQKICKGDSVKFTLIDDLCITGSVRLDTYNTNSKEIMIYKKDGSLRPFSEVSNFSVSENSDILIHYVCFQQY